MDKIIEYREVGNGALALLENEAGEQYVRIRFLSLEHATPVEVKEIKYILDKYLETIE